MTLDTIPDDVKRFILLGVPSVPYLEAMLLFRADPYAGLSAAEVARRLYLPEATAGELISQLADARVVAGNAQDGWRYAAAPEQAALIDALARCYSTNLIGVAKLIHAKSDRRAAQFADAFKIRRES